MGGLIVLDKAEHIPNNCTLCKHFRSYYEDYYYDELEPEDMGFCRNYKSDITNVDATMTCENFESLTT